MDENTTKTTTTITDLNEDLLGEILKRSRSSSGGGGLRSHMRFGRVCSSWRSAAATNPYKCVPWLMLSKLDPNQKTRSFFGLDDKQIHEIKFLHDANYSWCSGSSEGWLVMTHITSGAFLYNPITGGRINLPPVDPFVPKVADRYYDALTFLGLQAVDRNGDPMDGVRVHLKSHMYLTKAIVVTSSSLSSSCSPNSSTSPLNQHHQQGRHHDDIVAVVAIFDEHQFMGFCRPGDKQWEIYTHPHIPKPDPEIPAAYRPDIDTFFLNEVNEDDDYTAEHKYRTGTPLFADVILYRGALYAIAQHTAMVGVFKFDNSSTDTLRVIPEIQWLNIQPMKLLMTYEDWNYLVESCDGELLMVVRRRRDARGGREDGQMSVQTCRFLVFKLDESTDPMRWVRIKSLGDQILFLGINHSKSFRASDIPGVGSGNCIYFTTDWTWRHLCIMGFSGLVMPSTPYTCKDSGVFYLEDGRVESSRSFFTDGNAVDFGIMTPASTLEYPAIFITPNIISQGHISSFKYWRRYAIISAVLVGGTILLLRGNRQ